MKGYSYLAFDLGAASSRAILGTFRDQKIHLKKLTRFPNGMISVLDHLHWDVFRIWEEIKEGLRVCFQAEGKTPESMVG